ncbi:MAG: hypothetical protein ACC700_20720 [Anaerolineales bacterium]
MTVWHLFKWRSRNLLSVTATFLTLLLTPTEVFPDYARIVPGMSFVDQGLIARRGFQLISIAVSLNIGAFLVSTFAPNPDEIPVSDMDPKLLEVSPAGILRGPQGTLYGAGSMG